jgi:single-stranded-DNA-specific exonuclease
MKIWRLKKQPSDKFRLKFKNYSPFIQSILYNRGIKSLKKAEEFFDLDYEKGINDPFLLPDMKKAIKRTLQALKDKEKIAIYGDYDADGVTSTVIIKKLFKELKTKVVVYIPDRLKEGYGLNVKAIKYLKKKGVSLVITVDTGIRNVDEIKGFNEAGIDVIITDHHTPHETKLPKAYALVNPHLKISVYPFKFLSGAGVAFKFAQALIQEKGEDNFSIGFEKWLLDLTAIGTIADMVPLLEENRIIAKYGLIVVGKTRRLGLKALMDKAGINYNKSPVRSEDVGFLIGPRINAAGRMDHANSAFALLSEDDRNKAIKLADDLEVQNKKRQELTKNIFQTVEKLKAKDKKYIFAGDKDWPLGVVGLVAGRLSEKFSRPVLIYMKEKDQIRGSARSIPEFNIIKALDELSDYLTEYGGHSQAAGFTIKNKNIEKFEAGFKKLTEKYIDEKALIPKLDIDYEIDLGELDENIFEEIKALEPFGMENEEPVFSLKKVLIKSLRYVGNGEKHLKLMICKNNDQAGIQKYINCIGFNFKEFEGKLKVGDLVDIAFTMFINSFNGSENLEFKLIDIQKR